ncbi:hypothetical protein AGLY_002606 [Aphis glycines]|uniref:Uncharacterized protein n=1 Tax=Aphis glycines TaxID=307491 RepID=A0A6G0U0S4_APHGL|nr:hypothetical protein AGLY_002606 [Aphis glycines]
MHTLCLQVYSIAIQNMCVIWIYIDVREKICHHIIMIALHVISWYSCTHTLHLCKHIIILKLGKLRRPIQKISSPTVYCLSYTPILCIFLTHVFIHIERFDVLERNISGLIIFNQVLVHTQWHTPVGNPKTKYLSGPGLKCFILFTTYLAAHSETFSALSIIISLMIFIHPYTCSLYNDLLVFNKIHIRRQSPRYCSTKTLIVGNLPNPIRLTLYYGLIQSQRHNIIVHAEFRSSKSVSYGR